MKDNIEDRLRYKSTQLTGVMPNLGESIDTLCSTYASFHNSDEKTKRVQLLRDLRNASVDCQKKCKLVIEMLGGSLFEGALPSMDPELAKRVKERAGDELCTAYQTLALLGKNFVGIYTGARAFQPIAKNEQETTQERIQLLFQMHVVAGDIAELSLITSPEPRKFLITN